MTTPRRAALDQLRHWQVKAPKGHMIYGEGDLPKAFYRVETGCVRLLVTYDDGHRQILAFCLAGDIFGMEFGGVREATAEAAAASELTRFPITGLAGGLAAEGMVGLVTAASEMIGVLSMHLKGIGHGSAEERLIWFLDWLADRQGVSRQGGVVKPPMSRRDIADFLGLAPETLSRTFARLEARRLFGVADRRGVILRPRLAPPRLEGAFVRSLSERAVLVPAASYPPGLAAAASPANTDPGRPHRRRGEEERTWTGRPSEAGVPGWSTGRPPGWRPERT